MPPTTPRASTSSGSHHRRPLSTMKRCPTEILCYIFAEACTDGGYTGRSLSLVSKRVCGASRRYALQSIALYGSSQLSAFASLLDTVDADSRVYHLYLADRRRVQIVPTWPRSGSMAQRARCRGLPRRQSLAGVPCRHHPSHSETCCAHIPHTRSTTL